MPSTGRPVTAKDLALALPPSAWQTVSWRAGRRPRRAGRALRRRAGAAVAPPRPLACRAAPRAEEWLPIAWPEGRKEPSKHWLATLPATTALVDLVGTAKLRRRIERGYRELKQELGLDHCEGRGWRGFHHHATSCIAAHGSLVRERSLFPPRDRFRGHAPALPAGWRPRGRSAATGAS
jgi:SRSO17 transposase